MQIAGGGVIAGSVLAARFFCAEVSWAPGWLGREIAGGLAADGWIDVLQHIVTRVLLSLLAAPSK